MTKDQAFPSTWLSKADVPYPIVATIAKLTFEPIKNDSGNTEQKPVLHFIGGGLKPMIMNQTNWGHIEAAYGNDSDMWGGKPIEVYFDPSVPFGGKIVGGIRVRIPSVQRLPPAGQPLPTGPGFPEQWTLAQACEKAEAVGISKAEVGAMARQQGWDRWLPERDTAWLKAAIIARSAALNGNPEADAPLTEHGEAFA